MILPLATWLCYLLVGVRSEGRPWVHATVGEIWPQAQMSNSTTNVATIDAAHFKFTSEVLECDVLQKAYTRYHDIIFGSSTTERLSNTIHSPRIGGQLLDEVKVFVMENCETLPTINMDEAYELRVCTEDAPDEIRIISSSVWGALRGLETFSQLLYPGAGGLQINCTQILDYPRFTHRGFMLDTSRHYLPLASIMEHLELMAMNKYNVFHWHVVDDQSFPYVSDVYPGLSTEGSWTSKHIYTKENIATVIQTAADYGIRVIPEFDTPGHTLSWGPSQPGLLTPCYKNGAPDGTFGPIDPSNAANYDFIEKLFTEVTDRFPDYYIHLGGDEVPFGCWQSNPNITAFMAAQNISGQYGKLEQIYIQKLLDIVAPMRNHTTGYLVWQEVFDNGVKIADDTVAGPYYTGTPEFIRLDSTDAMFVDAVHTDADSILFLGYGTGQPMGNVDLYPNSGHDQPGCDPVSISIDAITDIGTGGRELFACSHDRSHVYVSDALKYPECNYLAHECYDYDSFKKGECGECLANNKRCTFMGLRGDEYQFKERKHVKMFFDTDKNEPHCLNHYRISVLTAKPAKAEDWVIGHLVLTLYGQNGNIIEKVKVSDEHERIDHGQMNHFLFTSKTSIDISLRVEAKWVYDDNVLNPGTYCWPPLCNRGLYIDTIEVSPINYYPDSVREAHTKDLCSITGETTEVKDGHTVSFVPNPNCIPIDNIM